MSHKLIDAPPVADSGALRAAFGRFATGVVAVTYEADGVRYGMTANSFTSVSLDPALALVAVKKTSRAREFLETGYYTVNVLAEQQLDTGLHFAGRPGGAEVEWLTTGRSPRLAGALAYFECEPWATYDGGDHVLVVGRITAFGEGVEVAEAAPLVFFEGAWRRLAAGACA
ncbi:flavin reductase family protein [Nocardioides sp. cx-173]|uniref:flavin reductase family protein n=1 Tax=Nocardioides sp. cx-173 TaxID=2898796 RepID=UPI001E5EC02A|nr:flavin reductase family protein [Nocardioides sp. cx-173]MCD4526890.1 flavin reductase family protein [Nocardioides sp. cx-173]UGB41321.1 flavin reductase family protein [Nocardioides sp. cx-173]